MNLASKGFVASPSDISALTLSLISADRTAVDGRATYLKALVATTINELGAKARKNVAKAPKLKPDEVAAQVGALAAVHERFYTAVIEAASKGIGNARGKNEELNRRTNFARTSLSAVRSYIRAGNDVTYLVIARLTKRSLAVERPARVLSIGQLKRQMESHGKALLKAAVAAFKIDAAVAVAEINAVLGQLTAEMALPSGTVRPMASVHPLRRASDQPGIQLEAAA